MQLTENHTKNKLSGPHIFNTKKCRVLLLLLLLIGTPIRPCGHSMEDVVCREDNYWFCSQAVAALLKEFSLSIWPIFGGSLFHLEIVLGK